MAQAACKGHDTNLWFPERGEPLTEALTICQGCSVAEDCLAYALRLGLFTGVYGGLSARARKTRAARLRAAGDIRFRRTATPLPAPPAEPGHGTNYAYQRHLHEQTVPCAACRHAQAAYRRQLRQLRHEASSRTVGPPRAVRVGRAGYAPAGAAPPGP